ncbi:MAG TPA: hypothetical protein VL334_06295, partial [Anaerolineae bacterium]|nr:hypothetical protein [Anaerolineae bacterium]
MTYQLEKFGSEADFYDPASGCTKLTLERPNTGSSGRAHPRPPESLRPKIAVPQPGESRQSA